MFLWYLCIEPCVELKFTHCFLHSHVQLFSGYYVAGGQHGYDLLWSRANISYPAYHLLPVTHLCLGYLIPYEKQINIIYNIPFLIYDINASVFMRNVIFGTLSGQILVSTLCTFFSLCNIGLHSYLATGNATVVDTGDIGRIPGKYSSY